MRTECPDRYRCTVHDKLSPKETIRFYPSIAYVTNFCQEIDDSLAVTAPPLLRRAGMHMRISGINSAQGFALTAKSVGMCRSDKESFHSTSVKNFTKCNFF